MLLGRCSFPFLIVMFRICPHVLYSPFLIFYFLASLLLIFRHCRFGLKDSEKTTLVSALDLKVRAPKKMEGCVPAQQQLNRPDLYLTKEVADALMCEVNGTTQKFKITVQWLFSLGCAYPSEKSRQAFIAIGAIVQQYRE